MSYNISSSLSDLLHSAWHFLSPFMLLKMALFHSFSWYPWNFPGGSVVKNLPASTGYPGLIPGSGRSPGEGNGYPLQYSCLEKPMDRGAWQATYSSRSCKELDMTEWPILLLPSPPQLLIESLSRALFLDVLASPSDDSDGPLPVSIDVIHLPLD